ncbi:hypothetical protein [Saccharothrix sp. ALI-22-I]|uniref:hypothetical protein n=1 Tax=Saccharothrix sp. ALI-22-I TaxID=1933778 RepID=UPI0015C3903D|nr:hypothetical protein [Saccharothrix sp. ALI-22-I]
MTEQWWLWAGSVPVLVSAVRGLVSVWKLAITVRGTKGAERARVLRAYAQVASEESAR